MSESMWEQPAEQVETEASARGKAHALSAVAGFESFVSTGSSESDVDNRIALLAQPIEASVLDATGDIGLVVEATEHLREIWRVAHDERLRTEAAKALVTAARTGPTIDSPEGYEYTPAPEAVQRAMRRRFEGGGITGVHPDKPGHFLHGIGNWWDGPHEVKDNGDGTYSFTNPYNGDTDRFDEHGYYDAAGNYTRYHSIDYTSDRLSSLQKGAGWIDAAREVLNSGFQTVSPSGEVMETKWRGDTVAPNGEGAILDAFTASMLVQIYDALGPDQQARFGAMPLAQAVDIGWKLTNRTSALQKGAPFAGYEDFAACVAANSDKDDPEAYCGKIKHQVEDGKTSSKTAAEVSLHWKQVIDAGISREDLMAGIPAHQMNSALAYWDGKKTSAADTGQRCPDCRQYEMHWQGTGRQDPDTPEEAEGVLVCDNCDRVQGSQDAVEAYHSHNASLTMYASLRTVAETCSGAGKPMANQRPRNMEGKFFGWALGDCPVCGKLVRSKSNTTPRHSAETTASKDAAFFHHEKPSGSGPMGDQSEWDRAAAESRKRREEWKAQQKAVQPTQPSHPMGEQSEWDAAAKQRRAAPSGVAASLDDLTDVEFVEAHLMVEAGLAFRVDDLGHPMAHPYGPSHHKPEKETEPEGSVTYHVDDKGKPGFGLGSFEHEQEISEKYDPRHHRRGSVEAGFVDRMHRFLEREHATGNLSDDEKKAHQQTIQLMQRHKQEIAGDRESNQNRKQYYHQHPDQKGQYQRIAAYDPDEMFPNVPPDKRPYPCQKCGLWRNAEDCPHCKAEATRADIAKGYRGPTFVDWLMHGLLPSGAHASLQVEALVWDRHARGEAAHTATHVFDVFDAVNGAGWLLTISRVDDDGARVVAHTPASSLEDGKRKAEGFARIGSLRTEAVNESAYGTERYQAQPSLKPRWAEDEWGQPGSEAPWGYFPGDPIGKYVDGTHIVQPSGAQPEMGVTGATVFTLPEGFRPNMATANTGFFSTAAEFHHDPRGQSQPDEFAQMRTPVTTRPRQHPHPSAGTEHVEPSTYEPGSSFGGGDEGGGTTDQMVDYSAPTFEQQVAAKIGGIAHKVVEDNPHLSLEQGRAIAMQAISKHPGMVGGSR